MGRAAQDNRAGQFRRSAAERNHNWRAERGGNVHRAGVIGEQDAAEFRHRAKLAQGGFAGEIYERGSILAALRAYNVRSAECGFNLAGNGSIPFSTQNQPEAIRLLLDLFCCGDETVGGPALGGAVFRAGIKPKHWAAVDRLNIEFLRYGFDFPRRYDDLRRDGLGIGAECRDEMEILVNLIGRIRKRES